MDLKNIDRLGSLIGGGLNIEEIAGLEVAMMQRKLQENLPGNMFFWGKIIGTTQDYLIVYTVDPTEEFPSRKYFFTTTSNYILKSFPSLTSAYEDQAKTIKSLFTGDPSFFNFSNNEEEEQEPEPENQDEDSDNPRPQIERFREMHRLAYIVKLIDHDCSIVPRGSFILDATKRVVPNIYFAGLDFQSSTELKSFLHIRQPESINSIAVFKKPGISTSSDFLDCIDKDFPKGMWSLSYSDSQNNIAYIRNLYWYGFGFYSVINSSEYGNCYIGNGIPNYDIVFML